MGGLAQLEQALIRYTVDRLEKHGFTLVSVPDLIHPDIVVSILKYGKPQP